MLATSAWDEENNVEKLMYEIEEKRAVLVALGMKKGFQDPEVLFVSEHLDKLLNFYYSIEK